MDKLMNITERQNDGKKEKAEGRKIRTEERVEGREEGRERRENWLMNE